MNVDQMTDKAHRRLADAPQSRTVVLAYAAILTGVSMVGTLLDLLLTSAANQSGGLGGMGMRSVLMAVTNMLPVVQLLITLCLALGYRSALLRVARGQYVSVNSLRMGLDRFWVLLRLTALKYFITAGLSIASMYLAVMLFLLTPFSDPLREVLAPLMGSVSTLNPALTIDEATYGQVVQAMTPMLVPFAVLLCVSVVPVLYRLRMAEYVIIDHPEQGALTAMKQSRKMMRGNCKKLLKVDLYLWWYYGAMVLSVALCYGDLILSLLGVNLPGNPDIYYYGFSALYLAAQFAIFYFLGNQVGTTYALAYDAIRPEEPKDGGAVLGNIFQM